MTQQYTPVSWQDETTSQQGTLINAERLNQMQTAHHFADGLEEVDTVPTADPGVAYHKIVYCTADNTLYRWDGEAWTADIDDPTRELLEEHEADHENPHQVTKAQVGLGNCNNTSDADKPISTATQTALNAKADKSDTYTKAQTDSLLGGKVDKQDSSAGMIAYTAEEGTEGSTEINGGAKPATIPIRTADGRLRAYFDDADPYADDCVTYTWTSGQLTDIRGTLDYKADKATTLAGYGITDAYTKTEADTLLGAKADQATTYSKSEVQTYVSNALDGYLPMVRTTGNQTIAGAKTFTNYINAVNNYQRYSPAGSAGGKWIKVGTVASNQTAFSMSIYYSYGIVEVTGKSDALFIKTSKTRGSGDTSMAMVKEADGSFTIWWRHPGNYLTCYFYDIKVHRYGGGDVDYFTASSDDTTYDTPTVGEGATLINSTEIDSAGSVHTSGTETVSGIKTFDAGAIYIKGAGSKYLSFINASAAFIADIRVDDNGAIGLRPGLLTGATKSVYIQDQRAYDPSHTTDVATIGTLDAYTPMVRTSGNQDIMGIKTVQEVDARIRGYKVGSFNAEANKYYKLYEYADMCNFVLRLKGDQPNNNVGWIKVFIGGTALYTRSALLEKVSRYSTAYLYTCTNTTTNKDEIIFYTGTFVLGTVNIELMEGYMGSTFVSSFEETTDPNTDGNHTNIQRFG